MNEMNFHGQMMNLRCTTGDLSGVEALRFKEGHKQARHLAAEAALQADAKIEDLSHRLDDAASPLALHALLALYRVLEPAAGDFTEQEQAAMDLAISALTAAGYDLDEDNQEVLGGSHGAPSVAQP